MNDQSLKIYLEKELASLNPKQREALQLLLDAEDTAEQDLGSGKSSIPKLEKHEAPASYAQERLWFLSQLEGANPNYNIFIPYRIDGSLEVDILVRCVQEIVNRHEVLRTRFVSADGSVQQIVTDGDSFSVSVEQLGSADEMDQILQEEALQSFELDDGSLFRARLLVESWSTHYLLLNMHHTISDGWSMDVFLRELSELYLAYKSNSPTELEPLEIQYSDYAIWQREALNSEVIRSQHAYWDEKLDGLNPLFSLPGDKPRPADKSYKGKYKQFVIPSEVHGQLKSLAQENDATLYMTLLSVFYLLLWRYSGESDVVVGTPSANRNLPELENLIGFFVNTLVLRTSVDGRSSFQEFLAQVRQLSLDAFAHQDVPFERLVSVNDVERSQSHSPLFQIMFVMHSMGESSFDIGDLEFTRLDYQSGLAKFDLTIFLSETSEGVSGIVEYNTDLYEESTIDRFISSYQRLLGEVTKAPEKAVEHLDFLTEKERDQILDSWTETSVEYPKNRGMHELFIKQSALTPNNIAVRDADGHLSYKELKDAASHIAVELLNCGVSPDELVGVVVNKSCAQVAAVMGVLFSGAAYLPVDVSWPMDRQKTVLTAGKCRVVLSVGAVSSGADWPEDIKVINVDDLPVPDSSELESFVPPAVSMTDLAYVIFTSGSTGIPKGVMIEHGSVVNTLHDINARFQVTAQDSVLALSSLSFDLSVYDLFGLLAVGGCVVMPQEEDKVNPEAWVSQIREHDITLWNTVPGVFQLLVDYLELDCAGTAESILPSLRLSLLSGDWLPVELPRRSEALMPELAIVSLGGATEASIWSNCYPVEDVTVERRSIPYGKPLGNQWFYILDELMQPCPIGVEGYLYIGGVGLARGYWDDPEQTANSFIDHEGFGERIYKTGDLGRWLADGNIEFLGRRDGQVKIRGFRIELGEVESQLKKHGLVNSCVAIVREDEPGDRRLVAYITTAGQESDSIDEAELNELLRAHLQETLPDYMVPSAIVALAQIPLTANGKVDRKSLPVPSGEVYTQEEYVAPQSEAEQVLVTLWAELLNLKPETISVTANFFELGGHSLQITRMLSELQVHSFRVDLRTIFRAESLRSLASELQPLQHEEFGSEKECGSGIPEDCESITREMLTLVDLSEREIRSIEEIIPDGAKNIQDIYPLTPLQEGIFFHHKMNPDDDPYTMSIVVSFNSRNDLTSYLSAMEKVVERHDNLRTAIVHSQLRNPVQVVQRQVQLPIEYIDPEGSDALEILKASAIDGDNTVTNLEQAPLFRLRVSHDQQTDKHYLFLGFHHLILDHVSLDFMQSEIQLILADKPDQLLDPAQGRELVFERLKQDSSAGESYFSEKLKDITEPTTPFGLGNVYGTGAQMTRASLSISRKLGSSIREAARNLSMSPAPLFHAAWALVLMKCTSLDNVVFGTVLAGRSKLAGRRVSALGMFINTLPLVLPVTNTSVRDLVLKADDCLKELIEHENISLAEVQRCSRLAKGAPVFSSLMNYRHTASDLNQVDQVTGLEFEWAEERSNYPLVIQVDDTGEEFTLETQVEKSVSAQRLIEYLEQSIEFIVEAITNDREVAVNELSILTESEKELQLVSWNGAERKIPEELCIHEIFERRVSQSPDSIALVVGDTSLSYSQLNSRANRIAHYLLGLGVGPETFVGICIDRSIDLIAAVLGVNKAGAAYIPIDPNYPEDRIDYLLENSSVQLVISETARKSIFSESIPTVIFLDSETTSDGEQNILRECPTHNIPPEDIQLTPKNLAYVIYTSGSTGLPKGVMIQHDGLVNVIEDNSRRFHVSQESRFLQSTPISFDAATWVIYMTLTKGGELHLLEDLKLPTRQLTQLINHSKISHLMMTPSNLVLLDPGRLENLRCVVVGGEKCNESLAGKWLEHVDFFNAYGPTEASICSTVCSAANAPNFGIGKPLNNVQVYVLGPDKELMPTNAVGELFIGGIQLARGYLNDLEKSVQKFIQNPFSDQEGERIYATGDLVSWRSDGSLQYRGRIDDQIKLRGFRIEPGEIESAINQFPGIDNCVVTCVDQESSEGILVAYIVLNAEKQVEYSNISLSLHEFLKKSLPEFMLPQRFIQIDSMPLSANGKVDLNSLPAVNFEDQAIANIAKPSSGVEISLVEIWSDVLGRDPEAICISTNFFDLGGHSLTATRIVNMIHEKLGVELPIQTLFELSNIQSIARWLEIYTANSDSDLPLETEELVEEIFF